MAAGLGFIEFSTGDVLSAAAANGYLASQTVMVFASAAARTSAITSPQEGMFSFLKDTNATQFYDGAAWVNLDTTGMVNPMTTTGDTIYSSSGTTPARLGIGTAGQVLTVNSGATAPEWAAAATGGGMTVLASGSLPTGSGTLTLSSISASYNNLQFVVRDHYPASDTSFRISVNNDTTANVYNQNWTAQSLTTSTSGAGRNTYVYLGAQYDTDNTNARNALTLNLYDYTNTTAAKLGNYLTGNLQNAGVDFITERGMFMWNAATPAAINRIDFMASSGNFSGGTYILYGVK